MKPNSHEVYYRDYQSILGGVYMMKKTDGPASKNLKLLSAKFEFIITLHGAKFEAFNRLKFGARKLQVFQRSSMSIFDRLNTP